MYTFSVYYIEDTVYNIQDTGYIYDTGYINNL
jgi:hypothetical protein